ncbi:hypothetical protein PIB30_086742 [Stylosanthes scabra]|uniref:Uncharacterized protein n=1 Tax=Stylosanthes scabra TaxID=79078 RepID=A0ABU6RTV3_9FABA|nr:hypothetical protein [Stylosanthes scabra]
MRQHIPEPARFIDLLNAKDGRCGDNWWPEKRREWHDYWDKRLECLVEFEPVDDPCPSDEYTSWWIEFCRRRFLSTDLLLVDPRHVGVSPGAVGIPAVPPPPATQGPAPLLDRRRTAARARVGTRASQRDHVQHDIPLDASSASADDGDGDGGDIGGGGEGVGVSVGEGGPVSQLLQEFGGGSSS